MPFLIRTNSHSIAWFAILALSLCQYNVQAAEIATHEGNIDPASEGFIEDLAFFGSPSSVAPISNDLGLPAWSILGSDPSSQGGYGVYFTPLQYSNASNHGFNFTVIARPVQHLAPVVALDSGVLAIAGATVHMADRRFDLNLGINPDGDIVVGLPNNIVPVSGVIWGDGETYTLSGLGTGYHTYSLLYDPASQSASLWVDGIERLSGFTGSTDYLAPAPGFTFAAINGGQANFNLVAFEAVPEPSSLILLGCGGAALVAASRRRWRENRSPARK